MKNLDGSLKNLFVVGISLRDPTCFVLKRVPHIWLILILLTLFSFQRTPNHFEAIVSPLLQWIFILTCLDIMSTCYF